MLKSFLLLILSAALLPTIKSYGQAGTPKPDAKFLPGVAGKNSSIGSTYSPAVFDGSVNVTIPIYDFSNSHGSFGVSFSYNTKGVKMDELPGIAGLHWTVNAGGTISRVLKNLPDELNQGHQQPAAPGGPVMAAVGRWTLYTLTPPIASNIQQDGENDDFNVSVGNLNFTFNIGKDGYVFTHPNRRVRIEKQQATGTNELKFVITDESGNRYFFEPAEYGEGRVMNHSTDNNINFLLGYEYVTSWVISRIVFAEGGEIRYEYTDSEVPSFMLYPNYQYKENVVNGSATDMNGTSVNWVSSDVNYKHPARPMTIWYPNGTTVSFHYDTIPNNPNAPPCLGPLKEVQVGAARSSDCIRYVLDRAWHNPGFGNTSSISEYSPTCDYNSLNEGRLILRGISMKSCDGSITEPYYRFAYSPYRLPYRSSGKLDRFGYNNDAAGAPRVGSNVPYHTIGSQAVGVDREVTNNVNILGAANLVQMTNAYGGSVSFTYELHSGLQNVIPNLPTDNWFLGKFDNDGLRVKTITETDKFYAGNARITTFTYSGGQRFLTGGYFHYLSKVTGTLSNWSRLEYIAGPYRISPLQLVNGSNHGYSEVKVEKKDQSGNLLGRTEYLFTNLVSGPDTSLLNAGTHKYYEEPYTDRQYIKDWMIGLPVTTTEYDQNDQIVSRTTNTYTEILDLTSSAPLQDNVKTMRAQINNNINPFTDPVIATDIYRPYTGKALLTSSLSEKFVNGSTAVNDVVNYGYDSRANLKWIKTRNSKGIYTLTEQTYNYDVAEGANPGGSLGYLYAMTANKLEKVVSTERWSLGTTGFDLPLYKRLLDASITGMEYSGGKLRTKSLQTLQTGNPIAYADYTGVTTTGPATARYNRIRTAYSDVEAPSFRRISEVQQFDVKGNPLETKLLDPDIYKAMVWDTTTGKKLAEVSNARYNEIAYTSFELSPGRLPSGSLLTEGRVSFSPSGLTTDGGAVSGTTAYLLSGFNLGSELKIDGLAQGKTYILSFWSKGGTPAVYAYGLGLSVSALYTANGWTYYQGKVTPSGKGVITLTAPGGSMYVDEVRLFPTDALMLSWTYKPLCGESSSTDATGRITYYEYDGLGRPTLVRNQEGHILSRTQYVIN